MKHSLIILEDEIAHAEAIRRSLSGLNDCNIIIANSLKEYGRAIKNTTPDLVLADINLPDGSSLSLLDPNIENQSWPIVVMTSFGDEETAVKAIKSGALDYIVKSPEAFNDIEHIVKRNLREWHNIQKRIESERKFRVLFESMAQGVVYQDANGQITATNSAAEKMLGLSIEQMQNKTPLDSGWEAIHEDGSPFTEETYPAMEVMHSGLPVQDTVMGIYHPKEKKYKWLLITAIPQFRENYSKPHQVFSTFTDITELKQAEAELKRAKERAEESDRFKTAFLANISHEIRTPMSGILGFAELLKTSDMTYETGEKYVDAIIASGRRMLEIINDLINISKIETGHTEIKTEATDIHKLLDELYFFFLPEANKKGIVLKINKDLPVNKIVNETDKTKLAQILTNLIKNALKFTCEGFVEFGSRIEGSFCIFYVKDTGPGIRKDLREKIFNRFQQGKTSSSFNMRDGVGLGLSISKAYVELLGGEIRLESDLTEGSIFYFTIPFLKPVKMDEPLKNKEDKVIELLPYEILIAEDEEFIYFYLDELLKQKNITTFRAKNGLEAVIAVKANPNIKLILMDGRMPVMNGLEATRQIKQIRPQLPIIALSALASDSDIQEALQAGCDDYITKPINTKELFEKISLYAFKG